jgi:hypothetical protein
MYRLVKRDNGETSLTLDPSVKHLYWGSTGTPNPINTADDKGVAFYFSSTATSGTTYGQYTRLDASGVGVEAIAGRSKVMLSGAAGNAHGHHATVEVTSTGYATGLCTGVRGNIVFTTDTVVPYGTYYGVMGEIFPAGATSALPTSNACLCCSAPTGSALNDVVNAIAFEGADGSGHMVYTNADTDTAAGSIRILVNGAAKYLRFYAAQA